MENNAPTCQDCCHLEVCAYATHDLPICDFFNKNTAIVRCKDCEWHNLDNTIPISYMRYFCNMSALETMLFETDVLDNDITEFDCLGRKIK